MLGAAAECFGRHAPGGARNLAPHYLNSGQRLCYDAAGREKTCAGSGQDGEVRPGAPWPEPRFIPENDVVRDNLTGLVWTRDANPGGFPLTWPEALEMVAGLNSETHLGRTDWRLPNRRELFSLVSFQERVPALPAGHPFQNVFRGWYWSNTSAAINPAYAWYLHTEGGRMFYGKKDQSFLVWPTAGPGNGLLPATWQRECWDDQGRPLDPVGSGQDGELRLGAPWPQPRFSPENDVVRDNLTGLVWTRSADLASGNTDWGTALATAARLNQAPPDGVAGWRLPTITELESLVDASAHSPALPLGHPFESAGQAYWSSTSSAFEPDWAMALYLHKGAVGVGRKDGRHFLVWAVH